MDRQEKYVKSTLKVLIYIENHIEEEISMTEIRKLSGHSSFHFQRIFKAIVGESLHRYTRRLRIEKAANRLLYTKQPITEIALKASYDTPSAFTRAFKQCTGKSPQTYRTSNTKTTQTRKKNTNLPMIKPDLIEKTPSINLFFIRKTGNYTISSKNAWEAMLSFIKDNQLDTSNIRYFSIAHDNPEITREDCLRFDACIQTSQKVPEKGEVGKQILKEGKQAIFTHYGPYNSLDISFNRIFLRWLPTSNSKFNEALPVFCEHFNLENTEENENKLITKIYIPLK